jgi:hypothetical protein
MVLSAYALASSLQMGHQDLVNITSSRRMNGVAKAANWGRSSLYSCALGQVAWTSTPAFIKSRSVELRSIMNLCRVFGI